MLGCSRRAGVDAISLYFTVSFGGLAAASDLLGLVGFTALNSSTVLALVGFCGKLNMQITNDEEIRAQRTRRVANLNLTTTINFNSIYYYGLSRKVDF
jgi:hypothetical protein